MFWSLLGVKGSKRHVLVNLRENLAAHFQRSQFFSTKDSYSVYCFVDRRLLVRSKSA